MSSINKKQYIVFKPYAEFLDTDSEAYFVRDIGKTSNKEYANISYEDMAYICKNSDEHAYELLHEDKPRCFHLDFDAKFNDVLSLVDDCGEENVEKELISIISGVIEDFCENYNLEEPEINVSSASNKLKYSFHFAVKNITLKNHEDSKVFHNLFLKWLKREQYKTDEYCGVLKYVDKDIYTRNRNMRMIGQSKADDKYSPDEPRPLKIYSGSTEIKEHFISYVQSEPIKIPKGWKEEIKPKKPVRPTETIKHLDSDEEIRALLDNTLHKTVEYNDWIQWVWACMGAGISEDIIKEYSEYGCSEKYDETSCEGIMNQYTHQKTNMGRHTLNAWAKEVGYDVERHIEIDEVKRNKKQIYHLTWLDILKKYHDKNYESAEQAVYDVRHDVGQVVSMIQGAQTIFTIYSNDENPYEIAKKLPSLLLWVEGRPLPYTLQSLMIAKPLSFPLYNKIVFKPNDHKIRPNERNIWTGFKAEGVKEVNMELITPFLNHIKTVWANNNDHHYKYFLTWLAQIIQTPYKPTDVAIILQGGQGSGKTLPCQFLAEHVFGKSLSLTLAGLSALTQRFNGVVKGKIFVNVNELSVVDSDSFNSTFDKMKALITDRSMMVEPKGLESFSINNYSNYIETTNHIHTVKLERGDRRYACFEVNDEHKGDYDYFDNLVDSFTDEAGDHLYQFLLEYTDKVSLRKIPETSLRTQMLNNSKNSVVRFIEEILEDDEDDEEDEIKDEESDDVFGFSTKRVPMFDLGKKKASMSNLYEKYGYWCVNNGEKKYANNRFGAMIPKELIKDKGNNRINKKKTRWMEFN